jgi:hypothetical protein
MGWSQGQAMMSNPNQASDDSKRFDELTGFGESLLVCRQCGLRLTYPASCRELGRVEAALEAAVARLTRDNMVAYVSWFVTALNAGVIQPTDFTA